MKGKFGGWKQVEEGERQTLSESCISVWLLYVSTVVSHRCSADGLTCSVARQQCEPPRLYVAGWETNKEWLLQLPKKEICGFGSAAGCWVLNQNQADSCHLKSLFLFSASCLSFQTFLLPFFFPRRWVVTFCFICLSSTVHCSAEASTAISRLFPLLFFLLLPPDSHLCSRVTCGAAGTLGASGHSGALCTSYH